MMKVIKTNNPKQELAQQFLASATTIKLVLSGKSLSDALVSLPRDLKPAVQALSFYAMRNLGFAREIRKLLVPKKPDKLIEAFLLLGLCLLEASLNHSEGLEVPDNTPLYTEFTLVNQIVSAASLDKHAKHKKGLLNAVLRRYSRERIDLLTQLDNKHQAIWNHPQWWISKIQNSWPNQWQKILQQANQQAPMFLRANQRKTTGSELINILTANNIEASLLDTNSIILAKAYPVDQIPGYAQGLWSVQDLSAQQAGKLLPLKNGLRVLDACAAPGGKTAHLLEQYDLNLTALDNNPIRLKRVAENLTRLDLLDKNVSLKCADGADLNSWWDGQFFDAILADVPCTASGVVRRHPDIRWLRRPEDIKNTVILQNNIINSLWQTLAPGGHMLYVTCSIFPDEGEHQIANFLQQNADAIRLAAPGQILPHNNGDGFFYALLHKAS